MTDDFQTWRSELLHTGDIIQDGDKSVSQPESEQRFNRYIEMLDAVSGQEGIETFIAIVDSLQASRVMVHTSGLMVLCVSFLRVWLLKGWLHHCLI